MVVLLCDFGYVRDLESETDSVCDCGAVKLSVLLSSTLVLRVGDSDKVALSVAVIVSVTESVLCSLIVTDLVCVWATVGVTDVVR